MNTRNTPAGRAHRVITTTRRPIAPVRIVLAAWLRLRIRWTEEEIAQRIADNSLSPAQHALWRECISKWRRELLLLA